MPSLPSTRSNRQTIRPNHSVKRTCLRQAAYLGCYAPESPLHMTRERILAEIARTADENGGVALGRERFYQETGIKESDWLGKFWVRWSDAVTEAGRTPNSWNVPLHEADLLGSYASLVRELGHIPVVAELKFKSKQDPGFPSHNTFRRFGTKAQQIARLIAHCEASPALQDVLAIARSSAATSEALAPPLPEDDICREAAGYVYLLRAGPHFKIGRSVSFERRSRELAIQLPERAETVHVISTDDAVGIEAYWHRRFESKRKNGEWFALSAQDVKAFKRRKFM